MKARVLRGRGGAGLFAALLLALVVSAGPVQAGITITAWTGWSLTTFDWDPGNENGWAEWIDGDYTPEFPENGAAGGAYFGTSIWGNGYSWGGHSTVGSNNVTTHYQFIWDGQGEQPTQLLTSEHKCGSNAYAAASWATYFGEEEDGSAAATASAGDSYASVQIDWGDDPTFEDDGPGQTDYTLYSLGWSSFGTLGGESWGVQRNVPGMAATVSSSGSETNSYIEAAAGVRSWTDCKWIDVE